MVQNTLRDFNILIVDADMMLGSILKGLLQNLGFPNVFATTNGKQGFEILQETPIDFMITEWNTREIDGLELLNRIRRDRTSPTQTLPVIMLTGRAEKEDVITARDYGINEYVIKPFTAKTIYSRLERLIEVPRQFVLSQYYVGPDRRSDRNKGFAPKDAPERRQPPVRAITKPSDKPVEISKDFAPKVWLPDNALKEKLGRETSLSSLITPAIIAEAQQTIEASMPESMDWLQENLNQLRALQQKIADGDFYTLLPIEMSEAALTMSARSGTFGYSNASKVAYLLYLFCRNHMRIEDPAHQKVVDTHINALQTTLYNQQRDITTAQDHEIICELRNLIDKYTL